MNNETIDLIVADKAFNELKQLRLSLAETNREFIGMAANIDAFAKAGIKVNTPKGLNEQLQKNNQLVKELNSTKEKSQRIEKQVQATRQRSAKQTSEEIVNGSILRRNADNMAKANSKLATAYERASAKLAIMKREYKNLAISQAQGNKLTKAQEKQLRRLELQIRKTDGALKKVDKSVGESFRNVGNYKSALGGLGRTFKSLLGAFGLTSGVFLFVNAVKDAFSRVREFDKSMQNLAGILRTTRPELAELEAEIIKVAGSSIKTSREVAGLAESLVTLGKSESDIKKLLKPVNDLSIGLETTGAEAAEFLVQTLNAFGASSDEASKYADIIATIRTSTSLDFQKMRDSFQYLTPISKILNKDLAYTGAVLGILADNGLKAESAGRLLGTAQQKLAKEGKTLLQALNEITDAQKRGIKEVELLEIASDLFGKQAAKVGIILANNTDVIETNSQAIRDNGGALDDLVKEQLKSLDAQLKILDSSYEELILTVENGEGSIGEFFKSMVSSLTIAINKTNELQKAQSEVLKVTGEGKGIGDYLQYINPLASLIKTDYEDLIDLQKEFNKVNKNIDANGLLTLQNMQKSLNDELVSNNELSEKQRKLYTNQVAVIQKSINTKKDERRALEETAIALGFNEKELGNYADTIALYTNGDLQKFISKHKEADETIKDVIKTKKNNTDTSKKMFDENNKQVALIPRLIKIYRDYGNQLTNAFTAGTLAAEDYFRMLNDIEKIQDELLNSAGYDFVNPIEALTTPENEEMVDALNQKIKDLENSIANVGSTTKASFEDFLPSISDTLSEVGNLMSALYDRRTSQIDDLIQKNDDYYTNLLASEEYSEEQRARIEVERNQKEAELLKKKRAEQKKQAIAEKAFALAQIAINTAIAVSSVLSTGGGTRYADFGISAGILTAFAIAQGALQAATVIAQPIPQFREGHLAGTYEGLAQINDQKGSIYREVVERVDGSMEMYSGRDQIISMNKGDKVHKASTSENMILNHLLESSGIAPMAQAKPQQGITDSQMDRLANKVYSAMIKGSGNGKTDFSKLAKEMRLQNIAHKI